MGTSQQHQPSSNNGVFKKPFLWALYLLLPIALLRLSLSPLPSPQPKASSLSSQGKVSETIQSQSIDDQEDHERRPPCNYSDGRWIPDARAPLYNGTSCVTIKDGQNCLAHGRPDTGYLNWRWRPNHCRLPPFDPSAFLRLIEHKHVAFIGDSMARNQLESLLCLLSAASAPELVYRDGEDNKFRRWVFRAGGHNATVSVFWSPFLVKGVEKSAASGLNHNKLYLDSPDERWAAELDGMDMVVFSFGQWYLHPAVYYENGGDVLGCHFCPPELNHTEIGFFDVYRKAFRTALQEVSRRRGGTSKKFVAATTFSPSHFEGEWDKFGACSKTWPYEEGEKEMEYTEVEMRKIAVEEVASAAKEAAEGGRKVRFEAVDVTKMAAMRPDGHPGPYMYGNPFADGVKEKVQNDCVHWCLPGPIDAWNEILLELLERWTEEDGSI